MYKSEQPLELSFREMSDIHFRTFRFFKNFSEDLKFQVTNEILSLFDDETIMKLQECDYFFNIVSTLTKEKAIFLLDHGDDYTYHQTYWYFCTIQPTLENYLQTQNFYELYPEYLV